MTTVYHFLQYWQFVAHNKVKVNYLSTEAYSLKALIVYFCCCAKL